ncbi:MAG: efflux RND transporter periplasmic adaptor subunit [Desulfuromonadaceae bacterium]
MKKILVATQLMVLTCLCSCGGDIEPGRTDQESPLIEGLVLAQVSPSVLPQGEAYVATVESSDRGLMAARIAGQVEKIAVAEGQRVEAGDLLLIISDTQANDRWREAEAARAEAAGAVAAAEAAKLLAEKNYARMAQLLAGEAVTLQEFDQVSAEREISRQQLISAKARLSGTVAAVAAAKTAFSYTRITAPYAGVVVRRWVEKGSTVMPGVKLLTLDRAGRWLVRADLPETMVGKVLPGASFQVEIPALAQQFQGQVKEILPAADALSRSFQIKIELADDVPLSAGMFARVRPLGDGPSLLLVPESAIVTRGQLTAVYVVENNRLQFRLVKLGRSFGEQVEILSGLGGEETLVVEGAARAKNGARVEE